MLRGGGDLAMQSLRVVAGAVGNPVSVLVGPP